MRRHLVATMSFLCGILFGVLVQSAYADNPPYGNPYYDPYEGVIRFMVKGQEMLRVDEQGLHVRADINYGGELNDYGTEGYDANVRRNISAYQD